VKAILSAEFLYVIVVRPNLIVIRVPFVVFRMKNSPLTPIFSSLRGLIDRLCGLVVEFLAADPEVPGSISDANRFSE
jgi:hypothetical protein